MSCVIIELDSIDSTNWEACRRIEKGVTDGTIITAYKQTNGQARRGRRWDSPPGNLYWSRVVFPKLGWPLPSTLSMISALAVVDLVRLVLPSDVSICIKWPNDILIAGNKLAGILLQSGEKGSTPWVICGIGVNLASSLSIKPPYPVTDLQSCGAVTIDRKYLAYDLARHFNRRLADYLKWGMVAIHDAVLKNLVGIGNFVTVCINNRREDDVSGRFCGLDDQCRAEILTVDGKKRVISAGDLFLHSGINK
ncbi:biotin-[acetyl-CoA-carboxylase] ligase [Candidatus Endolissoclinum faulkneri L5]|uniref:biotin--[biotin carboxyl-carrier protein] ligase n=1 Tax=Candidatus Endolissoclinum faulkneri L5 TaxID=1401328 RepID=V9TSQ6_9PROT|nr:biotin--[acetyl-CoA-carboxylase] ligase [Candidatus Endolissoclinum faulkneri]AHC73631.1 biotin-[acetyl-CoA-carboxylase] ligase [Candidatus Endolissoclinum faulkneri L5]